MDRSTLFTNTWGAWGGQPGGQDSTVPRAVWGGFLKEVTPQLKSRGGNVSSLQNLKRDVNMKQLWSCLSPGFFQTWCGTPGVHFLRPQQFQPLPRLIPNFTLEEAFVT